MLNCFSIDSTIKAIPIKLLTTESLATWLTQQSAMVQQWVQANHFTAEPESFCLIPNEQGGIFQVVFGVASPMQFWSFGALPQHLPTGHYSLDKQDALFVSPQQWQRALLAWGLGSYKSNYKNRTKCVQLVLPEDAESLLVQQWAETIYWIRDLINKPCEEMGPVELAAAAAELQRDHAAKLTVYVGQDLLVENYPAIYAVGRASDREPRLIDLQWGDAAAPKVTLVGKGVCFDTGGLNIKSTNAMRLMKKDMGGAAHVLGLARMIMLQKLPIRLRVLIPAVENAVDGRSYRPGDVVDTRQGLRVEITNTDAEGRVILGDALTAAIEDKPELLIDIATLTGAARVALGTEIPVYFTNNDALATGLEQAASQEQDLIWRLPLYNSYKRYLKSDIADCCNAGSSEYGGAITAALYLQQFVEDQVPWAHFDLMAWNDSTLPGRPVGGEAMAIRGLFAYLQERYRHRLNQKV